ncbi:MAG: hypothetical protein DRJ01_05910 [Bacteroidetes bacterium]|nr:MAG: hypothetical protein DRJ01_05910 [Bacteroidota bacterium]
MTRNEVLDKIKNGDLNFSNQELSGVDLTGVDLREANLRGADLTEANLRGADLREQISGKQFLSYSLTIKK